MRFVVNVVGPRAVFGVIVPSTNTVVEHDYWRAGVDGVAFRAGSMHIADPVMGDEAEFEALLVQIRASIDTAVRDVLTAEPERMVMGMSAETFWGGVAGNEAFEERLRARTGLPVTTGASACRAALAELGVRRIAVFSPYQPNRRPRGAAGSSPRRASTSPRSPGCAARPRRTSPRSATTGSARSSGRSTDPVWRRSCRSGTNLSFVGARRPPRG